MSALGVVSLMVLLGLGPLGLGPLTGCRREPAGGGVELELCPAPCYTMDTSQPAEGVDVLFVIDNSTSMVDKQLKLQVGFDSLVDSLRGERGRLPDLHIGVVTTDLGTGSHDSIRNCEAVAGDRGVMGLYMGQDRAEECLGPGQRYLVNVEPEGCEIQRADTTDVCESHTCDQSHCDATAEGMEALTLVEDERGCPRCRNYEGTMVEAFSCLTDVGNAGCGFEQHMEAMYKALDPNGTPENFGFMRDEALLAVVYLTDEDDCSASEPDILFDPDPSQDNLDSELGYVHSFRCFEFGVTCNVDNRTITGPRTGCTPRSDPEALLHPISRYTSFLESLKDPQKIRIAAIAAPVPETIQVGRDISDRPTVLSTCPNDPDSTATPAIRLKALIDYFQGTDDTSTWAMMNVCLATYEFDLAELGKNITPDTSGLACPPQPLAGCANGPQGTACHPCLPFCEVLQVEQRNTENERWMKVVPCHSVCTQGLCTPDDLQPCQYSPEGKCVCASGLGPTRIEGLVGCAPLLYPDGPTARLDPTLSEVIPAQDPPCYGADPSCYGRAAACWYIDNAGGCPYNARIAVIRSENPPPRTLLGARCTVTDASETACNDGQDNDEDCLIDAQDPDCP